MLVCQDSVTTYLGELYMKQAHETSGLVAKFRDIQAKLDRDNSDYLKKEHGARCSRTLNIPANQFLIRYVP